LEPDALIWM